MYNRKYCLVCSPYGSHTFSGTRLTLKPYDCSECGETDPTKFRIACGERSLCTKCTGKRVLSQRTAKRLRALELLGGGCRICGYNTYIGAIDFHHVDPDTKSEKFNSFALWPWKRIKKEMALCVPLCKNHHAEVHAGLIEVGPPGPLI